MAGSKPNCNPGSNPVLKSPLDPNQYQNIRLPNGLRALLISTLNPDLPPPKKNPVTGVALAVEKFNREVVHIPNDDKINNKPKSKCSRSDEALGKEPESKRVKMEEAEGDDVELDPEASFCLTVGAGHVNNPANLQGLAHLVEHACVSFGSKKYPAHYALRDFIRHYFGNWNATTGQITTNYFFSLDLPDGASKKELDVKPLATAVDIVADFVHQPLLPANKLCDEIFLVDSENTLREKHDFDRLWDLFSSTANETHPFRIGSFGCGNLETLDKPGLRDEMVKWMKRHYAANYMTLVISASVPLATLEKIVQDSFSCLPSNQDPIPLDDLAKQFKNPFLTPAFNRFYKLIPYSERQFLVVTWTLPPEFVANFKTKPLLYLSNFFGAESPFLDYVLCQGWGTSVHPTYLDGIARGFCSLFAIILCLTDKGLRDCHKLVQALYSYVRYTQSVGAKENVFNEMRRETAYNFHYDSHAMWLYPAIDLSERMQWLKPKESQYILTSGELVTDFDPELITRCLCELTPYNMNITLVSKKLREECGIKGEFIAADFKKSFLEECEIMEIYKEFKGKLPPLSNPFRMTQLNCVKSLPNKILLENGKAVVKSITSDSPGFCQELCSKAELPFSFTLLVLYSPLVGDTELSQALTWIWSSIVKDNLRKSLRQASSALMHCWVGGFGEEILLVCFGPPQGQVALVELALIAMLDVEKSMNAETFTAYHSQLMGGLKNWSNDSGSYACHLSAFTLLQNFRMPYEMIKSLEKMKHQDFLAFVHNFNHRMQILGFIFGCLPMEDGVRLANTIQALKYEELPEILPWRVSQMMQLPAGERCLVVKSREESHYSVVSNFYQIGGWEGDWRVLAILSYILRPFLFDHLRTKEKLSYSIQVSGGMIGKIGGLLIRVKPHPNRHSTVYVDERIDICLAEFRKILRGMSPAAFKEKFRFDALPQILDLLNSFISPEGIQFRKLSTQVCGVVDESRANTPIQPNSTQAKCSKYKEDGRKAAKKPPPSKLAIQYTGGSAVESNGGGGYFIRSIEEFRDSLWAFPPSDLDWDD